MSTEYAQNGIRFSIRLTVVGVFVIATLITSAIAISLQYHFSRKLALENALEHYQQAAYDTRDFLNNLDESASQAALILAKQPNLAENNWVKPEVLPLFSEVMLHHRSFYAIYLGFANGDFYEVVNLNSSNTARRKLRASPEDRWLVITVKESNGQRLRKFDYYDENFQLRISRQEPIDYDPRIRPWYTAAQKNTVNKTAPYLFRHLQASGQTYSIALNDNSAVLAIDITHSSLSGHIKARGISDQGEVYLFQENGELIASNTMKLEGNLRSLLKPLQLSPEQAAFVNSAPKFRISNELNWPPIDYAVSGTPRGYSIELLSWLADMTGLRFEYVNGYTWPQLVDLFEKGDLDILQPIFKNTTNKDIGLWSEPFLNLPYAAITLPNHAPIEHIHQLNHKIIAIPEGWTIIKTLIRYFPKIQILTTASPQAAIEAVQNGQADATLDSSIILHHTAEYFFLDGIQFHENIQFGEHHIPQELFFVANPKYPQLIEIINLAMGQLTDVQLQYLRNKWFRDSADEIMRTDSFTVPHSELVEIAKQPLFFDTLIERNINGNSHHLFITPLKENDYGKEFFAVTVSSSSLLKQVNATIRTSILVTVGILLLLLPICWVFAAPIVRPIKLLAAENDKISQRQYDQVVSHRSHIRELDDLNLSIVNMAKAIKQHEQNQRQLMDSLIQMIAQAIDDKSPYTAGHCERVPELAIMLVKAAEDSNHEYFRNFKFNNEDEFTEFRIGAWLHDCGKITTPEHIIDKGSKLETNYNRIHEIRMRFEVLWRDAEIDYWVKWVESPDQEELLKTQRDNKQQLLQDDFAFIANLNQGSEFVTDEQLQRLDKIAHHTWLRHFSDRLGLSPVEEMRITEPESELPTPELLISNKPEHLIPRKDQKQEYEQLGLDMDVPELLYNLGEHYNLSIRKGTLTKEDRFKIQEHMVSTIKMLDSLPFPEELSKVPRYASTHHETLNGKGYPRRLYGHDLSIPERIMALADIFEALTASDRPYKKAKTINEAISILDKMVKDSHIDRHVFNLFLSSGVYLQYAKQYLSDEQIDTVDINTYIQSNSAPPLKPVTTKQETV